MKFNDQGIIISLKKYGENSLIVKVFSANHGIYRGFVKSAKSSKSRIIFQVGNLISFEYRSRIEENLGQFFSTDLVKSYCNEIMFDRLKLDCINSLFSIVDSCFLEHENHANLFEELSFFLQKINQDDDRNNLVSKYVKLELHLLNALGYGIDLSCCVVTNSTTNLAFVSPKSGRAVSLEAGKSYENKLLKLPNFLTEEHSEMPRIIDEDLKNGLKLSGYFLQKFAFENREEKLLARQRLEKNFS
jgi:DNA repair protein RecO (recombination protein O)